MRITMKILNAGSLLPVVLLLSLTLGAQERRAMTLEDVMNFHHMQSPAISHDGNWVAYSAVPDRGDGCGVLVSAPGDAEYKVERGMRPRFSSRGEKAMFTQVPPFSETEGKPASQRPNDAAVLIRTSDGSTTTFEDVKSASFSTLNRFLFVHHHAVEDTTLTKEENEKLKQAGTPLYVRNFGNNADITLPFVGSYTVDSLSTMLVFTVNDTLEKNNGLYWLPLSDLSSQARVIDTTGKAKFNRFTLYEKDRKLAWIRAEDMEKDTVETARLFVWPAGEGSPRMLAGQEDAPSGMFLPFDNSLRWSNDGRMLFFGFRPDRFAATSQDNVEYESELDSIRLQAGIDVWHGEDPLIKTHEKIQWNQLRRQNLFSVYHIDQNRLVILADEDVPDLTPSPKGNYALASSSLPYTKRITWEGWFRDIYVVNLLDGEKTLVTSEHQDVAALSPGGRFLLFFDDGHWHSYDVEAGTTRNITRNIDVPFYNETMDRPVPPSSYRTAGWLDDGESVLIYDRYDIWRANLRTGNMVNMTNGEGRSTETVFRVRRLDDEPLIGSREELYLEGYNERTKERALWSARVDRQGVNLLLDEGRNLRFRLLSGDERTIVYTRESYDEFPDLWVTNRRFRNPVKVSDLGSQIEPFNWGTAELVSFKSADGVPLDGIVIKPGDYDPSKRYPVFVYYYEQFSQRLHDFNQTVINHRPSFGYYASNGYVIFLPDIHFKIGRPGMSAVNALVPGVQKLVEMGIADPGAIGLHGHSWSGYMTAYVVTQTDIFRAAIAGAPVSNMTSAYGGIRWGSGLARQFQYETGQSRLGSSIFDRRYLYIENSPLFYSHEINTPLLIMHGDVDEAVPWEQSIELYLAMRRAGKDIIFLQYRDEPHHPQKYPNKVDYTIRMKEYFDHHLRGYDPADWIIEGVPYRGQ